MSCAFLNEGPVLKVVQFLKNKCAYLCASILCILIFCLLFIGCFVPWYSDTFDGTWVLTVQDEFGNDTLIADTFDVSFEEHLFHMNIEYNGTSVKCDYEESCSEIAELSKIFPALADWDLTGYGFHYYPMFILSAVAMIWALIVSVYLAVILIRGEHFSTLVKKILTGIAVGFTLALFLMLFVNWTLMLGHEEMVWNSFDKPANYCSSLIDDDDGGVVCNWNGFQDVKPDTIKVKNIPFLGVDAVVGGNFKLREDYAPTGGWLCLMLSLGMSVWIMLCTIGWHPEFD
eukprot:TRINITY_DN17844_c0_g1_i1.p1 TRINITY_DN17844_c0_g1~~TRINITY_DN17844_c0_g1_i1.p1  ORF type:complete len:287 (+),score=28.28 TRINITY_DN17844_c0_g1_i1:51-911(+)